MAHESASQPYPKNHRAAMASEPGPQTLAGLLEQALRVQEEVTASLRSTQSSIQVEALNRRLLEIHINTITHIVRQLSVSIQALESEIAKGHLVASGTSVAVQSLDQKNTVGIGDLRGRVARCDASISKLSTVVCSGAEQARRLHQDVMELRTSLEEKLRGMETKLYQAVGRLESSFAAQSEHQKTSMSDLHSQVKLLEARLSGGLAEAKEDAARLRRWTEQQMARCAQTQTLDVQKPQTLLEHRMPEAESGLQGGGADPSRRGRPGGCESKLCSRNGSEDAELRLELQLLKQDSLKGFRTVHDAMQCLLQIGDTRARVDRENRQKDVGRIHRKLRQLRDL